MNKRKIAGIALTVVLLMTTAAPMAVFGAEAPPDPPDATEVTEATEAITAPEEDSEAEAEAEAEDVTLLGLPISDLAHDVTITPGANGTLTAEPASAKAGEVVHLYAHPDENCGLAVGTISVLTDSQQAIRTVRGSGTDDDPFWFTMPDDGVTVTSEFVAYREIVIADGIEHGTITVNAENNMAVKNEIITITLAPDEGYRLKFNGATNSNPKTLTFTDKNGGTVKYSEAVWGSGNWTYNPSGAYTWPIYDDGRWNGEQSKDLTIAADTYYLKMPDCDIILNAEFAPKYTISVDTENGTFGFVDRGRTEASVGEWVGYVNAVPDAGYRLVADSATVTDKNGDAVSSFNPNYSGFIMPASDVTVSAEFELLPPPPVLDTDFSGVAGDAEVVFKWTVHKSYANYTIYYREKGSEDAYKTQGVYTGGYLEGATYTYTFANLVNDTEYEFYLALDGAVSSLLYAAPIGIPPTSITLFKTSDTMPVGEWMRLYAEVAPAETKSNKVKWTSSNADAATIDENSGEVAAVAEGTTTITVESAANAALKQSFVLTVAEEAANYIGEIKIGTVNDVEYDEGGASLQLPVTFTVPLKAPVTKAVFDIAVPAVSNSSYIYTESSYKVNSISYDGQTLVKGANVIDDDGISVLMDRADRPAGTGSMFGLYNPPTNIGWVCITSTTGKFLEPGATYEFLLDVELLPTAPAIIGVGFSNSSNNRGFFCWNYQSPTSPGQVATSLVTGAINATWTGKEPVLSGASPNQSYQLASAQDLIWYANQWNTGTSESFSYGATLVNDIDLSGVEFNGIGTAAHPYDKVFNGNQKTVTYKRTVTNTDGAIGFINYMSAGAVNYLTTKGELHVTNGDVSVGGVIGKIDGSAYINSYTYNYVDIIVDGTASGYVGGLIGYVKTTNTYNIIYNGGGNYGDVTATGTGIIAVGGHLGAYVDSKGDVGSYEESWNYGDITGRGYVGGIVGLVEYDAATTKGVTRNKNYGTVTALDGTAAGGIAGKVVHAHIGGWYSSANSDGNRNYGNVIANTQYVGGIIGLLENSSSEWIAFNYNEGEIAGGSAAQYVGGIVGCLTGSETVNFNNNINKGGVVGGTTRGGVLAASKNALNEATSINNWYAETEGLGDAVFAKTAPASFLSEQGWSPAYSGAGGDGSPASPFQITNVYDFLWFTNQVNDKSGGLPFTSIGKDYCVILTADIDLSEYPAYQGIGTVWGGYPLQSYYGTFDGGGHTITVALDADAPGSVSGDAAIFRNVSGGAVIKNLVVEGTVKSKPLSGNAAGVALMCDGVVIENVTNKADVTAFGTAAGIANGRPASLNKVYNYGDIKGGDAAGLANNMYGDGFIRNCANLGEITGVARAAGIVGTVAGGNKSKDRLPSFFVENVINNGSVTQTGVAVKDAIAWYNAGDWTSSHYAAGIIGKIEGVILDLRDVTNNGTIIGSGNNVGGIIGVINHTGGGNDGDNFTDTDVRITGAVNNGDVASSYNGDDPGHLEQISVGGIVGNTAGDFGSNGIASYYPGQTENLVIRNSVNNGNVSGPDGANVGAIAGLTSNEGSGKVIVENNFNSGTVEGGGSPWADQAKSGTNYDPRTQEIRNGAIVDKTPPPTTYNPPSNSTPAPASSVTTPRSVTRYTPASAAVNAPVVASVSPETTAQTTLPEQQNVASQPETIGDLNVPTTVSEDAQSNNALPIAVVVAIFLAVVLLLYRGIKAQKAK